MMKHKGGQTGTLIQRVWESDMRLVRRVTSWPSGEPQTDMHFYYDCGKEHRRAAHKAMYSRHGNVSVEIYYGNEMEVRGVRMALFGVEISGLYAMIMKLIWRAL